MKIGHGKLQGKSLGLSFRHHFKWVFNVGVICTNPPHDVLRELVHFSTNCALNISVLKAEECNGRFGLAQLLDGPPTFATPASLLRRYGDDKALAHARLVHAHISRYGLDRDTFLGNCLVETYGKCGSMEDAKAVFDTIAKPNLYSWNILIKAYAQNGSSGEAQEVFYKIPNPDLYSWNTLINACGQTGNLDEASNVFARMPHRDVVSWNAMIAALSQSGHHKEALEFYHRMQLDGFNPNKISFICALSACANLFALAEGQGIHATIVDSRYEQDVIVMNALINMYGKCKSVHGARSVFDKMTSRDVVSWNAMVAVLAHNECGKEALDLFQQMQLEGIKPDKFTFVCTLDACTKLKAGEKGQEIHTDIVDRGYDQDLIVGTALVNMYGRCGSLHKARSVFNKMPNRDVVTWNAMIGLFVQHGHNNEALNHFHKMQHHVVNPNTITFIGALEACTNVVALHEGQAIHAVITDAGFEQDVMVGTALVNMYGRCGNVLDAMSVFGGMPHQDAVAWTTMIAVFALNGHGKNALDLFYQKHLEGIKPDKTAFVSALDACASLAALKDGKDIHAAIVDAGYEQDVMLGNALVNMYGKGGSPLDANNVFTSICQRSIVSWNAIITSFAQNGYGKEAMDLFWQMQLEGTKPDGITFISVLTACSHAGWVDKGRLFFGVMETDHGIPQTADHFLCMVDLLGRAGHLDEAEGLISGMPFETVFLAWVSILGACRLHWDKERGVRAANQCFELDPQNAAPYVLLSSLYATDGRWDDVANVREALECNGAKQ